MILIFWKQRLAFLAIPKTGTSAYAEVSARMAGLSIQDPPELKHEPLIRYNQFIRQMFGLVCDAQLDTMTVVHDTDFLGGRLVQVPIAAVPVRQTRLD